MADINVKLVKSLIGSTKPQIATAYALGLHKIGDESVQPDNAAHLVETSEVEQGGAE